jgi:TPR repeat protein/uncharacterized caspase-like protein
MQFLTTFFRATLILTCLPGLCFAQGEPARYALVLGNSQYEGGSWQPLANPRNDAATMARTLRKLRFQIVGCGSDGICLDATRDTMESAIRSFGRALQAHPGAIAFVYYSGHGVQARRAPDKPDENFLIPVASGIEADFELVTKAISVQDLLEEMTAVGVQAGIVVLDACRNNGLKQGGKSFATRGLASSAMQGFLIAYAAEPGQVAMDAAPGGNTSLSPYVRRLSEQLLKPESITDVFLDVGAQVASDTQKLQNPETVIRLARNLYLAGQPGTAAQQPAPLSRQQEVVGPGTAAPEPPFPSHQRDVAGPLSPVLPGIAVPQPAFPSHQRDVAGQLSPVLPGTAVPQPALPPHQRDVAGRVSAAPPGTAAPQPVPPSRQEEVAGPGSAVPPGPGQELTAAQMAARGRGYELGTSGSGRNEPQAVYWYTQAAKAGNAQGEAMLGRMYWHGRGGLKLDYAESVRWFRKAAEQGDSEGEEGLGMAYWDGLGVGRNETEALRWLTQAAGHGNARAQFTLGGLYRQGRGRLEKSDTESDRWFTGAAESATKLAGQGDPDAQYLLAAMYREGRGVPRSDADAVRWLTSAAEQGLEAAELQLGLAYQRGQIGLGQSDVNANRWFSRAAAGFVRLAGQGDRDAQHLLATMYENGWGLARSEVDAVRWFTKAAEQGDEAAQVDLGNMYESGHNGLARNDVAAVRWYTRAAEQGNPAGQNYLGMMYLAGRGGLAKNEVEAVRWYARSAEQGYAIAEVNLGFAYINGRGVQKSDADGLRWLTKAAREGNAKAQSYLKSRRLSW